MKIDKKTLEERINKEIKGNKEIVGYCVAKALKLPFPAVLIPPGLILLAFLSSRSRVFLILLFVFMIYIIRAVIKSWEYFILVFLNGKIYLLQIEGENLDVVHTQTYSYKDVSYVFTYVNKNLHIAFTDNSSKRYTATVQPNNASFSLEEFDVKKFCEEKKQKVS